jgi:uncharacterized protein involved in type VI secretion and phage assembly
MNFEEMALGVTLGVVSATGGVPAGLGLVKVKFAQKGAEIESDWIQVMSFFGGAECGAFFQPRIGDSALLAFAGGDPSKPYVLGFLWNGVAKPPVEQDRQQEVCVLKTRSGKTIRIDDSDGSGAILITDQDGNSVGIDTANKALHIESKGDLQIKAAGKLTIGAAALELSTGDNVKLAMSAASMSVKGGSSLELQATMIDLN